MVRVLLDLLLDGDVLLLDGDVLERDVAAVLLVDGDVPNQRRITES